MKKEYAKIFPLLAVVLFLSADRPAHADEIYCPPNILGESVGENVIVGETSCLVEGSEIKGNVEVSRQGSLEIHDSMIHGNIKVYGLLSIAYSTPLGNIECGSGGEVLIGCSVQLKGNIDEKCRIINACE